MTLGWGAIVYAVPLPTLVNNLIAVVDELLVLLAIPELLTLLFEIVTHNAVAGNIDSTDDSDAVTLSAGNEDSDVTTEVTEWSLVEGKMLTSVVTDGESVGTAVAVDMAKVDL